MTAKAEEPAKTDYTDAIKNASVSTESYWEGDLDYGNGGLYKTSKESFDFTQTITLPAGQYKMTVQAAYRYAGSDDQPTPEEHEYNQIKAGANTHLAKLYAKTASYKYEANVQNRWEGASDTNHRPSGGSSTVNGKFVPNSSDAVKAWFDAGKYVNELIFNVQEEGQVEIGIAKSQKPAGGDYTNIGAWTLTRLGDAEADPEVSNGASAGEYYLYNENSKTFLSRGASWGTQAVTDKYGVPFAWDPAVGSIKFLDSEACLFITDDGHCFTDGNSTGWTLEAVNGNTCLLKDTGNRYLKQENDGVLTSTTTAAEAVAWTFKTPEERNAIVATYPTENYAAIIQAAGLSVEASAFVDALYGSNFARKDMTSSIGTAKFSGNIGSWTWTEIRKQDWQPAYGTNFAEVYQATGTYSQRVSNLPSGIYKLTVNGFHRQGGWEKCNNLNNKGYQLSTATLEGNGQAVALKPWVTERTGDNNPNNTGQAVDAFNADKYNNEVYVYVAEDGILDISVNIKNHVGGAWVLFNNFTLTYFTDKVSEEDVNKLLAQVPAANTIPNAVSEKVNKAKDNLENSSTIANYNALDAAIKEANQFIAPFASLNEMIELCATYAAENYSEADADVRNTFNAAITAATNNSNAATAVDALNETYNTLEKARQEYVVKAQPKEGKSFDMTFKITNPNFDSDIKGWTAVKSGHHGNKGFNGISGIAEVADWWAASWDASITQEITSLPNGKYKIKAAAQAATDIKMVLSANDGTAELVGIGDQGGNISADGSVVELGQGVGGWQYVEAEGIVVDGNLTIKFSSSSSAQHMWSNVDHFTLTYLGKDLDTYMVALEKKIGEAKAVDQTKINTGVKSNLNNAIEEAEAAQKSDDKTTQSLEVVLTSLSNAIKVAESIVEPYKSLLDDIAVCREYAEKSAPNAENDLATFNKQIETAVSVSDSALLVKSLTAASEALEKARQTYVVVAQPTGDFTFDMTFMVVEPEKWENGGGLITTKAPVKLIERYFNDTHKTGVLMSKKIENLPLGTYNVEFYANANFTAGRGLDAVAADGAKDVSSVYANGASAPVPLRHESSPNNLTADVYTVENAVVMKGALEVGIRNDKEGANWTLIRIKSVQFLGSTLEFCIEALNAAVAEAKSVDKNLIPAIVEKQLEDVITAAGNVDKTDKVAVETATNNINMALNTAAEYQDAFSRFHALVAVCNEYVDEKNATVADNSVREEFKKAIAQSKVNVDTITMLSSADKVYDTLEQARQAFTFKAYPAGDFTFDMTFLIANVGNSTNGWKKEFSSEFNKNYQYQNSDNKNTDELKKKGYIEAWNAGVNFKGTLTYEQAGIPNGHYSISAYAFTNGKTAFVANDKTAEVKNTSMYVKPIIEDVLVNTKSIAFGLNIEEASWVGITNIELRLTSDLTDEEKREGAILELEQAIVNAQSLNTEKNVGEGAFMIPAAAVTAIKDAIREAKHVALDVETLSYQEVADAVDALNAAIEVYKNVRLNAPAAGKKFNLVLTFKGWDYDGMAMTYFANDRSDAGKYNIKYAAAPNASYAQAFTFTPAESATNGYYLSMTDVDGNERYICTGVAYGGNTAQIRTTTDATKALIVQVRATATEGVYNLWNTEAKNYIGSQDDGVFTVNSHIDFKLVAAEEAEVTVDITIGYATLMLPFNAELPAGMKAYTCTANADEATLTLTEVKTLAANTPYLVEGEGSFEFNGYGLATKDSYTSASLTGTYTEVTAPVDSYVLQNGAQGFAFYHVAKDKQPKVGANRCYLTVPAGTAKAPMFSISRGEDTTGIENSTLNAQPSTVIYDLMGRKVTDMVKGNMYIVNGKKVIK